VDPNPDEVAATRLVTEPELREMMAPESGLAWSPWFRIIASNFLSKYDEMFWRKLLPFVLTRRLGKHITLLLESWSNRNANPVREGVLARCPEGRHSSAGHDAAVRTGLLP
jgi:hypothetical protein